MASAWLFQHETRGHARPVTTSSTAAIFSHVREGNWFEGEHAAARLVSGETSFRYVQRARSRCRPRTVEGTRGGAAIPAMPLPDFARHCYTNLVSNIIIQNCISRLHSGISAPWSHIVIVAVIQNDVVAGSRCCRAGGVPTASARRARVGRFPLLFYCY
jgi:hypothetical protein